MYIFGQSFDCVILFTLEAEILSKVLLQNHVSVYFLCYYQQKSGVLVL